MYSPPTPVSVTVHYTASSHGSRAGASLEDEAVQDRPADHAHKPRAKTRTRKNERNKERAQEKKKKAKRGRNGRGRGGSHKTRQCNPYSDSHTS